MSGPLRGHKGDSFLDCGGFWLLNDEGGADFIPTPAPSAVDQLADLARAAPPSEAEDRGRRRRPPPPNPQSSCGRS
jgi:hypothetical protein